MSLFLVVSKQGLIELQYPPKPQPKKSRVRYFNRMPTKNTLQLFNSETLD